MKTLVVMPTFNEAQSLESTIEGLLNNLPDVEILVVDDNSKDGTAGIADSLALKHNGVSVLHRPAKEGLGPAYIEGFRYAISNNYELICEMDADGSHQAVDLSRMLAAAPEADLVIGSRWIAGGSVQDWPISRLALSKFGNLYARTMLGTRIFDMTSGFRVYKAEFLEKLISSPVSSQGYSFQVELAFRASKVGIVKEVPIAFIERAEGKSKMTLAIVIEALLKIQLWGIKRILS